MITMPNLHLKRDPVEALATDFLERQRRGLAPTVSEYVERYPQWADEIRDLFPTISAMEQWKNHKESSSDRPASLGVVKLDRLGDFRILREIGRGGMGIVYEAEQESLRRLVAVKVLPRQTLLDDRHVERFRREAQTAARLHHTNIVPVFGVGEQDGYHYYVMQIIHGVGLDQVLRKLESAPNEDDRDVLGLAREAVVARWPEKPGSHELPDAQGNLSLETGRADEPRITKSKDYFRSVAQIGLQVGAALEYAHSQGTLHRDVKPANLLMDRQGVVWVADFGLARPTEACGLSRTGDVVGTLRYMAPEQFAGQAEAASDVYSLGLTLYELLTLRPAYEDSKPSSLIQKITQEALPRPRKTDSRIPRDLETIVLKAIARDPAHRYSSAGELAEDLRRFLDDRPIRARRVGPLERAWRWSGRNRSTAALLCTVAALLLTIAVVATFGYLRTRNALAGEATQRQRAEATSKLALDALDSIFCKFAPDRVAGGMELKFTDTEGSQIEVPGQPVLSKEAAVLLQELLTFYDRLAEQGCRDVGLRRRVADANRRVGDIRQRLGQFDQAEVAYARAVAVYQQLGQDSLDDSSFMVEVVRIHNEQGNIHWLAHRPEEAGRWHREALALLGALPPASADQPSSRYELARTHYLLGRNGPPSPIPGPRRRERERNRGSQVKPTRQARSPRSEPSPPDVTETGQPENPHLAQARAELEQLVEDFPNAPVYRQLLACCYREQSILEAGEPDSEPTNHRSEAIRILEGLVQESPDDPDYRYELCKTYLHTCVLQAPDSSYRLREAETCLQKALQIADGLVAEHPNVPDYAAAKVHALYRLAEVFRRKRQPDAVERKLREALEVQSLLTERFPEASPYRAWTAIVQESLAKQLAHRGQLQEARLLLEESVEILNRLLDENAQATYVHKLLARSYTTLADVLTRIGNDDATAEAARLAEVHRANE